MDEKRILIEVNGRRYLKSTRGVFSTSKGLSLDLSTLKREGYGLQVAEFRVFKPTLEDIIMRGFKRITQIVYPKDSFYALLRLGMGPGKRALEVGTGSGAVTAVMIWLAGENGFVLSCEREEKFLRIAVSNIQKFREFIGEARVEFLNIDLSVERLPREFSNFDLAFIDVRHPWEVIPNIWDALIPSATVGLLLPTTNQVSQLLKFLEDNYTRFPAGCIDVLETLHRYYKPVPERLRPEDRMVAHTGYLVFFRKLVFPSAQ